MKEQLDEIGEISVRTVDGDKLRLEAEDFEQISEDEIRIWFRFPGGNQSMKNSPNQRHGIFTTTN